METPSNLDLPQETHRLLQEHGYSGLVDISTLQDLLDRLAAATGVAAAIMTPQEEILVAAGWQDLCTRFHRAHPVAARSCSQSDARIKERIQDARHQVRESEVSQGVVYHCAHGLVDMAVPVIIGGQHVATFFMGQFLFREPDREAFARRAEEWGMDVEAYLQALEKVPVISEERAHKLLDYAAHFARLLAILGLQSLQGLQARKEIESREETLRGILNSMEEAVWSCDLQGNIIYLNPAAEKVFGRSLGEMALDAVHFLSAVHPEDQAQVRDMRQRLEPGQPVRGEYRILRPDGEVRWLADRVQVIPDARGNPGRVDGIAQDITDRKRGEARIFHLSFHDQVTGLYNRAFFEEELRRLDTPRQLPLSIIMGDINGLKLVNDACGHEAGDRLLQTAASIQRQTCREDDIVARWGGDEFAILLVRTEEAVAWDICRRINQACIRAENTRVPLSLSLAAAGKVWEEDSIFRVLKEAEERMYRAKMLEAKSARSKILDTLQRTLAEKTHETEEHAFRMQSFAMRLGNALGLSRCDLDELVLLAGLHDIGKIAVPESILNKPGRLNSQEWETVQRHCESGYRIARSLPELVTVSEKILSHHERWDGSGYPRGLQAQNIPLLSRIVSVVDAFDVMVHGRPYQKARSAEEAAAELERCAGSQFDASVVNTFTPLVTRSCL